MKFDDDRQKSDIPLPPDQERKSPVKEPPETPEQDPPAPVREPGSTPPRRLAISLFTTEARRH